MKRFLVAVVAIAIAAVAGAYGYRNFILLPQLRAHVASQLSDPDSALFRNERYVGDWTSSGDYCGEINGKNKMGGYVGYVEFKSIGGVSNPAFISSGTSSMNSCDEGMADLAPWWWLRR